MSHIEIASFSTSIRLTSIESIRPFGTDVQRIANKHGFDIQIESEERINAPFCGFDYHVQQMTLTCSDTTNTSAGLSRCLTDLTTLEEKTLADGYFEIVG